MSETNYGSTKSTVDALRRQKYDVDPPKDPHQALLWEQAINEAMAIDQQRAEEGERLTQARKKREAALQEQANIDQAEANSLPDLEAPPLQSSYSGDTNQSDDTVPSSPPDLEAPPVPSPPKQKKHNDDQPSSAENGSCKRIHYLIGGSFLLTVCGVTGLALNGQCVKEQVKDGKTASQIAEVLSNQPVQPKQPSPKKRPSKAQKKDSSSKTQGTGKQNITPVPQVQKTKPPPPKKANQPMPQPQLTKKDATAPTSSPTPEPGVQTLASPVGKKSGMSAGSSPPPPGIQQLQKDIEDYQKEQPTADPQRKIDLQELIEDRERDLKSMEDQTKLGGLFIGEGVNDDSLGNLDGFDEEISQDWLRPS